ncbi:MAG: Asp-tRNA(Asn)/Glu-tRNA(Gln) amidotransferase subunit GatC [Planctomycetota bacterium]
MASELPAIDDALVKKLAKLSRLSLSDDEAAEVRSRLAAFLDYAASLSSLDLDGVEPLAHLSLDEPEGDGGVRGPMADDVPQASFGVDVVEQLAPEHAGALIRVPKVIDGGSA